MNTVWVKYLYSYLIYKLYCKFNPYGWKCNDYIINGVFIDILNKKLKLAKLIWTHLSWQRL